MRVLLTFVPLFLSVMLLQLSSGAIGPLDVLSGIQLKFSNPEIGLLGSAHFLGFFIGCWWAPRLMGAVGHSRSFAVFTVCGAMGAIAHPLLPDATIWALLRIMTGLCIAGCYTVIEAWMQAMLTNQNRGKVMGFYRVVDIGASSVAQLMIGILEPASYVSYNLLGILCCACVLPLTLSTNTQPKTPEAPRLRPIQTALVSPLGAAGVMIAGLTASSFRMVGPIYGQGVGLNNLQIGYFLATVLIGGAVAQFPVGWLADRFDRRWVLIGLSALSVLVCGGVVAMGGGHFYAIFIGAALFGIATFPIFSVASAHTNDFTDPDKSVEVNASLMFIYGIGAIFSPFVTSSLIDLYGPTALFAFIAVAHLILVLFSLTRMLARPTLTDRTSYTYLPRTSFTIFKLFRRSKHKSD
jgi:MFS family permease